MRRRLPHAELMDQPVRLPSNPAYPDTWSGPDPTAAKLALLQTRLWKRAEWREVENCPYLRFDPHKTWHAARSALRQARRQARTDMRRLRYGPVLMRAGGDLPEFRRRLRRQARRRWLALHLYGIRPCRCGAWHARPWLARRSR